MLALGSRSTRAPSSGDPRVPAIGPERLEEAKRRLIEQQPSHLDSLSHRLREPGVQRVIELVTTGEPNEKDRVYDDDIRYIRDLGLIAACVTGAPTVGASVSARSMRRRVV